MYPGAQTLPHHYGGPEGHYLTLTSPDGGLGIRFETNGHSVERWYAGTTEAIGRVEGCQ